MISGNRNPGIHRGSFLLENPHLLYCKLTCEDLTGDIVATETDPLKLLNVICEGGWVRGETDLTPRVMWKGRDSSYPFHLRSCCNTARKSLGREASRRSVSPL